MKVVGQPSPDLDSALETAVCVVYDAALVDLDERPRDNGSMIRSDVWVTRGEMR